MNTVVRSRAFSVSLPARAWLFSAPVDLAVFGGSALVSLALLVVGHLTGMLHDETPDWAWVPGVLLVDVAHVWATGFVVYVDRRAFRERPRLYTLVPLSTWALGVALYSESDRLFWRALAYAAVFHFVRQQFGWVMAYRARAGERGAWGRAIDGAAVYAATLYPLVHWHARLPRAFAWFVQGDFASLPRVIEPVARIAYATALLAYAARALVQVARGEPVNVGKHVVVATTALTWWIGIVAFDSDYAFTVTNVFAHGVPYLALVAWYGMSRGWPVVRRGPFLFLAAVWCAAFVEELLWDRSIWHERSWLFGAGWELAGLKTWLVPLLAVPQMTHYVLDGVLWRRASPGLRTLVEPSRPDGTLGLQSSTKLFS